MSNPLGHRLPPVILPPPTGSTAVLRQPAPPSATVVPVGVTSNFRDTEDAPVNVPLTVVRSADGHLRLDPAPMARVTWGDPVRFRAGPPRNDPAAPEGAVHIDTTTGRGYRLRDIEEA